MPKNLLKKRVGICEFSPFFPFCSLFMHLWGDIFVYTFRGVRVLLDPFKHLNPFLTYTRIYGHRRAWDTHIEVPRTAYGRRPLVPPYNPVPRTHQLRTTEVPTPYRAGTHHVHNQLYVNKVMLP